MTPATSTGEPRHDLSSRRWSCCRRASRSTRSRWPTSSSSAASSSRPAARSGSTRSSTLVPAASNIGHHAQIVREMATLRGLTVVGEDVPRLGWERPGETPELVDRAEQMVFELAQQRITRRLRAHRGAAPGELRADHEDVRVGRRDDRHAPGFRDLDKLTSGLQPGNLVILAGRPSMGKSAFALGIAANLGVRKRSRSRCSRSRCRRSRSRSG